MPSIQAVFLVAGCVCVVAGAAVLAWPAGLIALGVLMLLAVVDLRR